MVFLYANHLDKGELIRPLLTFTKDELMKIPHFEDSSNDSQDYFRNRVRHQYLPEFEKENPQMQASLRYLAEEVNSLAPSTERID